MTLHYKYNAGRYSVTGSTGELSNEIRTSIVPLLANFERVDAAPASNEKPVRVDFDLLAGKTMIFYRIGSAPAVRVVELEQEDSTWTVSSVRLVNGELEDFITTYTPGARPTRPGSDVQDLHGVGDRRCQKSGRVSFHKNTPSLAAPVAAPLNLDPDLCEACDGTRIIGRHTRCAHCVGTGRYSEPDFAMIASLVIVAKSTGTIGASTASRLDVDRAERVLEIATSDTDRYSNIFDTYRDDLANLGRNLR